MIREVNDRRELDRLLSARPCIYTEKIRSFADGYGFGYDFCRFAAQDDTVAISSYYGDATMAALRDMTDAQAEELASFLALGQYSRVLMPYRLCERLGLTGNAEMIFLMKCNGSVKMSVECNKEAPSTESSLGQIYEIAGSGFDIDRDKWYTDTSHMLRHGIARAYTLENAACAIRMFASGGISYVSYVCTRPEMRGRGLAKRLLRHICAENAENGFDTYVFCGSGLRQFYEDAGFSPAGHAAELGTVKK